MLNERDKALLGSAYRDAAKKVADLPGRIKDEDQQAEAEKREPYPIQPLTAVSAELVVKAIEAIKDVPQELGEIVRVQRQSCSKLGNATVYLLSEQLAPLLTAAGIGEPATPTPTPAPVEG